ncbi:MAG: tRNA (adenosine(37)-N6)-dimethylallyltransferase MiaA [Planctomycetota bacterium]
MTRPFGIEPLAFLVGATAVGKTRAAIALAEAAGAEIVSMDSMLVYRGMDVGTAKPSAAERARVPHHVLDRVAPNERYDVRAYLDDAEAALADIRARGGQALFVGGTGFYLKALAHGLFEGPPTDLALRAEFEARYRAEGALALHAELAAVDAELAARLHPNDRKRVLRGLEIYAQTGRPLSELQSQWRRPLPPHRLLGLTRPLDELDRRIAARTATMLAGGWIDEVRRIEAATGFSATAAQALGYPEVRRFLAGDLTRDELGAVIAQRTRRFARKQATWLRAFPVTWKHPDAALGELRAVLELDG